MVHAGMFGSAGIVEPLDLESLSEGPPEPAERAAWPSPDASAPGGIQTQPHLPSRPGPEPPPPRAEPAGRLRLTCVPSESPSEDGKHRISSIFRIRNILLESTVVHDARTEADPPFAYTRSERIDCREA